MTTTILNTNIGQGENKIPVTSGLVTTTIFHTKFAEVENKVPDHAKYITSQEFNSLTAENVAARQKQVNLVSKTNFDNRPISFNRKLTSNKTKYLDVQKEIL